MASKNLTNALERVNNLKADLKEANLDLKVELEATPLYKAILSATLEQSTTANKVPEKAAAAQALKVTLAVYNRKEENDE
jgi:hypothetical protein